MAPVLVDTSVWVLVSRGQLDLSTVVDLDDVVTCPPVIQEVLQGIRFPRAFVLTRDMFYAMEIVERPMPVEAFSDAASLYLRARMGGETIRSAFDCLIAACAIRNHLPVLHVDRDYDKLAKVTELESRRLRR